MARWENDVPVMHSVERANYFPYLLDYHLNAFQIAEVATTKVIIKEEAEVVGTTGGEPPDPYLMTEADERAMGLHPFSEPVRSRPIPGIVFTPPDSDRKN